MKVTRVETQSFHLTIRFHEIIQMNNVRGDLDDNSAETKTLVAGFRKVKARLEILRKCSGENLTL